MSSILRTFEKDGQRVQWTAHDKADGQAAKRRLKQLAEQRAQQTKERFGVEVDLNGRTPAGLIVPGAEPRKPRPSMGGRRGAR